jgi:hypothetical protein
MEQLLSNPGRLMALVGILAFVILLNLPLLFPKGLGKMFEREAKTWSKALKGGTDISAQNTAQMDELHKQVEELKSSEKKEEQ